MSKMTIASPVRRLVEAMPPALQAVYNKIDGYLAKDTRTGLLASYAIGLEIDRVKGDSRKYGESAMEQLAVALNMPEEHLWHCHKFTKCWTKAQFEKLVDERNSRNGLLSVAHLRELSRIEDSKQRLQMQKQCLVEAWSSRDLAAAIQHNRGHKLSAGGRKPLAPNSPVSGLQQFDKLVTTLVNRQDVYDDAVFSKIDTMSEAQINARLLEELTASQQRCQELLEFAQGSLRRINVALNRVRAALEGKPAKAGKASKAEAYDDSLDEGSVMPPTRRQRQAAQPGSKPAKLNGKPAAKAKAKPKAKGTATAKPGQKPAKKATKKPVKA